MISFVPPLEAERVAVDCPISEVTILEDRAVVRRSGTVSVRKGLNRVRIMGVAPVLQDVSLRAESSAGRVSDSRVRRAMRVRREDKPAELAAVEQRLREVTASFDEATERRSRAEERSHTVYDMLLKGAAEVPQDASWGVVDPESWTQTFSSLFERGRELQRTALDAFHSQQDLEREVEQLARQCRELEARHKEFVAWAQVDVMVDEPGTIELSVEYVVPNALWRPIHRARLTGDTVAFTARAAIWQNTGEDWSDVQIVLSTARSSLGTDPPLLSDDLLSAQRRSEDVVIEAREVAVNRSSAGAPSKKVELPGVDDGGEVQNLRPAGPSTVPSDGTPLFVDTFGFESPARPSLVCMPEVAERAYVRCNPTHTGSAPVLAGPVELVRDNGTVGWTEVLYVAPGASFELGFGPEGEVRVSRHGRVLDEKTDSVDKWTRKRSLVELFLSNVGQQERTLTVTERIPVAEIEQVKVSVLDDLSSDSPTLDENGFVTWTVTLASQSQKRMTLGWELALAPDVAGI